MHLLARKSRQTKQLITFLPGTQGLTVIRDPLGTHLALEFALRVMSGVTTPLVLIVRILHAGFLLLELTFHLATGSGREPARATGIWGLRLTTRILPTAGLVPSAE